MRNQLNLSLVNIERNLNQSSYNYKALTYHIAKNSRSDMVLTKELLEALFTKVYSHKRFLGMRTKFFYLEGILSDKYEYPINLGASRYLIHGLVQVDNKTRFEDYFNTIGKNHLVDSLGTRIDPSVNTVDPKSNLLKPYIFSSLNVHVWRQANLRLPYLYHSYLTSSVIPHIGRSERMPYEGTAIINR